MRTRSSLASLARMGAFLLALAALAPVRVAAAPPASAAPLPRADHGARLEPRGRILQGAGQDPAGFARYWDTMGEGARPALIMHYVDLQPRMEGSLSRLYSELQGYDRKGVHLVAQIGLAMTRDGKPSSHYEDRVAAGAFDLGIDELADELAALGHPVLLRIGYEFNGTPWNGYRPATYVAAFRRIVTRLRERQLDVAMVWDAAGEPDQLRGFMDFYPGDAFVDWWGLNLFSGRKGSDAAAYLFGRELARFLDAAEEHHKPVLIGEATPRYTGVGAGGKSWDRWYADFFDLIARRPGIKAISYINWNWAEHPQWSDWGDARLEADPVVAARFRAVVSAPPYLSGAPEVQVRAALGLAPAAPPPPAPATPAATPPDASAQ